MKILRKHTGYSMHRYEVQLTKEEQAFTDKDLINRADGGPFNFGGHVTRSGDRATIIVYVD